MFCPNCGKDVPAGMRFCANCGFQISKVEQLVSEHNSGNLYDQPAEQTKSAGIPPMNDGFGFYTPPEKQEKTWHGVSYMEAFRVVSGIMFLIGIIGTVLNPIITNLYYRVGATNVTMAWWTIIEQAIVFCLIPGLFSLICRKPRKANNLILVIVFAFVLTMWVSARIIVLFNQQPWAQKLLDLVVSIPISSIFCFIMALLSLKMPEFLVGEPRPVLSRGFKLASGIIHLVGAGLLLSVSVVFFIIFLIRGYSSSSMTTTMLSVSLFSMAVMVFFAGLCSIRAGAGKGASELPSIYVHLVLVYSFFNLILSTFINSLYVSYVPRGEETAKTPLLLLGFSIIPAWYIVCLVIGLKTFLQGRKTAA